MVDDVDENVQGNALPDDANDVVMEEQRNDQVARIAVKAPPFWPEEPELWFVQLEGQFALAGIAQDTTKYSYVIAHIDTKYAREVRDIVLNPPARGKYETLKRALVQRLATTQEQRIRQLLEHEEMGDRKPSQFLRHLQSLGGENIPDQLLRTLWLGRLPQQAQVILASRSADRLEDVAMQADRILEVSNRTAVAAIAKHPTATYPGLDERMKELMDKVDKIVTEHRERRSHKRSQSRNRTTRNRSSSRPRKSNEANDGLCFFHQRFGEKAKKCREPCNFKKEN